MAYFRIYLNSKNQVCIVQMEPDDEFDYKQERFLSEKQFDTEDEALVYLEENSNKLPESVYNPYAKKFNGILD